MDIAINYDSAAGQFDIALDGPDLQQDSGLRTAVLISLFTDRQATADDVLPDAVQGGTNVAGGRTPRATGTTHRRGWWANPKLGSRLWLLARSTTTDAVLQRAEEYCIEALQWLVDDGVASAVDVQTEWQGSMLAILVEIIHADGGRYQESITYSLEAL